MKSSLLLYLLLITALVMGVAHFLAIEFFLYWQYPWFDIPMHILGGVIIAFFVLVLPDLGVSFVKRYTAFSSVLAMVLIVGLLWEIFEIWIDIPLFEPDFEQDIVKDLLMDLVGGSIGYFVGTRINTLAYE